MIFSDGITPSRILQFSMTALPSVSSLFLAQPYLRLPGRDGELEVVAPDLHIVAVNHAAVTSMAKSIGPDAWVLPFRALVDGDNAPVAAGEDDEAVIFEKGALGCAVHGVVECDHPDDVSAAPCLVPAVAI